MGLFVCFVLPVVASNEVLGFLQTIYKNNHCTKSDPSPDFTVEQVLFFVCRFDYFYFVFTLLLCLYVYQANVWCPRTSEEGVASPGSGVTDGCVPPRGC